MILKVFFSRTSTKFFPFDIIIIQKILTKLRNFGSRKLDFVKLNEKENNGSICDTSGNNPITHQTPNGKRIL